MRLLCVHLRTVVAATPIIRAASVVEMGSLIFITLNINHSEQESQTNSYRVRDAPLTARGNNWFLTLSHSCPILIPDWFRYEMTVTFRMEGT